jgi:hypothetical protein
MLSKVPAHILEALQKAEEARRRAAMATNKEIKTEWLDME